MNRKSHMIPAALAGALTLICGISGCSNLQGTLSAEMQSALESETGTASIAEKAYYYNGLLAEDVSSEPNPTLLVNFGKKIAIGTLSGSMELVYTNESGNSVTETFSTVTGNFSEDLTGFRVNLTEVMNYFNSSKIPSGTALMNLKLGGFKCAEGSQNGRPISSFEVKNIKIQPLFKSYSVDYSTSGFGTSSKIELDLNGKVSIKNGPYSVTGTGSDSNSYKFTVSAEDSKIVLTPEFTEAPADGVSVTVAVKNILPVTGGTPYEKDITLRFSKHAIVIDGQQDKNYEKGTVVQDASSDQNAFSEKGFDVSSQCDIQKVFVTSDDDYVYIGVYGNLNLTWNNTLSILISNGSVTGGNGARAEVLCAGTEDFAVKTGTRTKVQPNVYISHQPGYENDGSGKLTAAAYVNSSNGDISSSIKYAPAGWTESTYGTFAEYAVPLGSVTGLNKGDSISVIVAAALHWDDGNAVADAATDESVTYIDANHTSVKYDFGKGISYSIPASN